MHMGRFARGLAQAAERRGAQIHTGTCVQRLERLRRRARRTACTPAAARVRAQQVLLATGAARHGGYGSFGWLRRRIVPIGSFIVVTEPLGAERAQALLRERRTYVTVANIHHYFRLTPDHRLVFGGRARFAVSSPQSDAKSGEILRAGMVETFPQLRDVRHRLLLGRPGRHDAGPPAARRRARRPVLLHRLQRPRHADVGADGRAHGGGDGRRCRRPTRGAAATGPRFPGHFGPPWFLPAVGLYYRLKDRLA